jgi:transketolase
MEAAIRDGYGNGLEKIEDVKVVVLDADVWESTRAKKFKDKHPERFFSMGISEADMISTAAGLASCDKIPFASSFSGFLIGKAYDQMIVSVAYPKMNVKIVGSHAGLATGEDGATAQAMSDIAAMRAVPNISIISPADAIEAEKATIYMAKHEGPVYLRLARPKTELVFNEDYEFEFGKAVKLQEGSDVSIFATGIVVSEAVKAVKLLQDAGINVDSFNIHTIKPIDKQAIVESAKKTGLVITIEDHNIIGGLGSAVAEVLSEEMPTKMKRIGLNDRFHESGTTKELYHKYGLDAEGIFNSIKNVVGVNK